MLFEEVWTYRSTEPTNVIDMHSSRLRWKLDPENAEPIIRSVRDTCSRRLAKLPRTTSFRLALCFLLLFSPASLVLFGFLYWQTKQYVVSPVDDWLVREQAIFSPIERDALLFHHRIGMKKHVAPGEAFFLASCEY